MSDTAGDAALPPASDGGAAGAGAAGDEPERVVVDSSVVVERLIGRPVDAALAERLRGDVEFHAPHLIDVEVLHVLRRLVGRGALSADRAADGRRDLAELLIERYPHGALVDRAWDLRVNLTAYDAVYVALAEALDAVLLTRDTRIAGAPGHLARVEVY